MSDLLFLHALDLYHSKWAHEEFSQPQAEIERSANEYLRIALCVANTCVLPASSFFESEMTRRLLRRHPEFVRYRRILLSATESSIAEHVEKKLNMYEENSPEELIRAYKGRYKTVFPGYLQKAGSSTGEIAEAWLEHSETTDIRKVLDPNESLELPLNFEEKYRQVPLFLEGRAFVTSHAQRLLEIHGSSRVEEFKLAPIIQPAYANSYSLSLSADILVNVPILNVGYEDRLLARNTIDMNSVISQLTSAGFLPEVFNCSSKKLFSLISSNFWADVRASILNNQLEERTELIQLCKSKLQSRMQDANKETYEFQSLLPGIEKFLAKEEQPIPLLFSLSPTKNDDLKMWRRWAQKMPNSFSGTTITLRVHCAATGKCTFRTDFTLSPKWVQAASPLLRVASLGLSGLALPSTNDIAVEMNEAAAFMNQLAQINRKREGELIEQDKKHFSPGDIKLVKELYELTGFAPAYAGMEFVKVNGSWSWVSAEYFKSTIKVGE